MFYMTKTIDPPLRENHLKDYKLSKNSLHSNESLCSDVGASTILDHVKHSTATSYDYWTLVHTVYT